MPEFEEVIQNIATHPSLQNHERIAVSFRRDQNPTYGRNWQGLPVPIETLQIDAIGKDSQIAERLGEMQFDGEDMFESQREERRMATAGFVVEEVATAYHIATGRRLSATLRGFYLPTQGEVNLDTYPSEKRDAFLEGYVMGLRRTLNLLHYRREEE